MEDRSFFTLADARAALAGRTEFAVHEHDGVVSVNYLVTRPDSFAGVRREFRGVTFDAATGRLLSLPFHKFFNLNQTAATQFHALRHLRADVYEKLDGTLVHWFRHPAGDLRPATRMSHATAQARAAGRFAAARPELLARIAASVDAGLTPLFEHVGPDNPVVVRYPAERLVYLHSRDRATGRYVSEADYPDRADRHPVAFADVLAHADRPGYEGFVCHLETGEFVKVKGAWYLERAGAADWLARPAFAVYEAALQGKLDDLLPLLQAADRPRVEGLIAEAGRDLVAAVRAAEAAHATLAAEFGTDRKGYAAAAQVRHPDLFAGLMRLFIGRPPHDALRGPLVAAYRERHPGRLFATPAGD